MEPSDKTYRILFLGASYGVVLGMRMAAAGHRVTFACRDEEAQQINRGHLALRLPSKEGTQIEIRPRHCAHPPLGLTPDLVRPEEYDLVCFAMQEPQYSGKGVRELVARIGAAALPCLSIMNMCLPPFLSKLTALEDSIWDEVFTEASLWSCLEPELFTMASADPQAKRVDDERGIVIEVTLPTNFKVAPLQQPAHQQMLETLADDIDSYRFKLDGANVQPRIRLRADAAPLIPLAKWPMLITGNFRCMRAGAPVSIAEAVCSDVEQSRDLYEWVRAVCLALGVDVSTLVSFERYQAAAEGLSLPSSLARGLHAGAVAVERVDKVIQALARRYQLEHPLLDVIVEDVDDRLQANRAKQGRPVRTQPVMAPTAGSLLGSDASQVS